MSSAHLNRIFGPLGEFHVACLNRTNVPQTFPLCKSGQTCTKKDSPSTDEKRLYLTGAILTATSEPEDES